MPTEELYFGFRRLNFGAEPGSAPEGAGAEQLGQSEGPGPNYVMTPGFIPQGEGPDQAVNNPGAPGAQSPGSGYSPYDPFAESFPQIDDGQQLIRRIVYYSIGYEDEYGFFNPSGFETIKSDKIYEVASISSMDSRANYSPSPVLSDAYDHKWIYGEEPIRYKEAVEVSKTESAEYPAFVAFSNSAYRNLTFTSYIETETYLNWYDYTPEDLDFGFNWKNDRAEWRQSNQLRTINKPFNLDGSELPSGFFELPSYNVHAEAPHLLAGPDHLYREAGYVRLEDGFSAEAEEAGFLLSTELETPTWLAAAMARRFKSQAVVNSAVSSYLDNLTAYATNTGFTTILKRALSSEVQDVTRFTRREFTGLGESTLSFDPAAATSGTPSYAGETSFVGPPGPLPSEAPPVMAVPLPMGEGPAGSSY